ncbi:MAG: hypothetical protein IJE07_11095 [Clostridia bacterium]|nr:hypothetical protein [Clostridia bacterium]
MSCPYYHWDHGYACKKTGKNVSDDTYNKYCRYGIYDYQDCPVYKHENDGGGANCFLTSACVEARGLPDDCHELTTLRRFRDEWLAHAECGQCTIARYYEIAPTIVEQIKAQPDAMAIFEQIYTDLVLPCVALIEKGENEACRAMYQAYVEMLQQQYPGA